MSMPISWGSDVDISMPEPLDPDTQVTDLGGGHVFGRYGLGHNLTRSDLEVFSQPIFAPIPSAEGSAHG